MKFQLGNGYTKTKIQNQPEPLSEAKKNHLGRQKMVGNKGYENKQNERREKSIISD